jgi:UDP-N-acetyl-L-fucosamine synthase
MSLKKLKVMTVVGTRPEIIRLSRVLVRLDEYCEHVLVHTGQNYDYELNQVFFDDLGIRKPDFFLDCATNSTGAANTIGNLISAVDVVLNEVKPDAMLVLGDTNSCLSVIPAKRRKIPIFHMEAGNRCFDQRVPEETNRRIVDHTADINLTYSSIARDYLLREGLQPDQIIKTGSPMYEVLLHYRQQIDSSEVLTRLKLASEKYFLVSAHREENVESDESFEKIGQGTECACPRPWPTSGGINPPPYAETSGCNKRKVPPACSVDEAAGFS